MMPNKRIESACAAEALCSRLIRDVGPRSRAKTRGTRKHANVWRVAHLLLGQPVVIVTSLVERLKVTFPSANAAVATLVDLDFLRPQGQHRRNRAFHAHEVINLLYTGIDAVLDDVATLRNYRAGSRA